MERDIPFVDPFLDMEELEAVADVVKSRYLIEGKYAREFESKFASYTGVKHAITCINGTAALHLALEALELPPGSEVISTPFTFIATSNSILFAGLVPKFVDVDPATWNLDPDAVEKSITPKTKAIMPVHIFGLPADMKRFREIADDHGIYLVEDAAQGFGARIDSNHVGGFGDIATFSLYATKNLISGEGGVVTTNRDDLAERVTSLKNHGRTLEGGYKHIRVGYNYRMTDLQAAIANVQMDKADQIMTARSANARYYREVVEQIDSIGYQRIPEGYTHGDYIFAIDTRKSDLKPQQAVNKLKQRGVLSRPIYNKLSYQQENFRNIESWKWAKFLEFPNYRDVSMPIAEEVALNHFEIPVVPSLSEQERLKVGESLKEVFS